jgi:hypothetical protein
MNTSNDVAISGATTVTTVVTKMAEKMLNTIKDYGPHCSFVELENHCGAEAEGDFSFSLPGRDDLVLWAGVSEVFIDAFFSLRGKIQLSPSNALIYFMDGKSLTLPVAKRVTKKAYKKAHWMPVTLALRSEKDAADYAQRQNMKEAEGPDRIAVGQVTSNS